MKFDILSHSKIHRTSVISFLNMIKDKTKRANLLGALLSHFSKSRASSTLDQKSERDERSKKAYFFARFARSSCGLLILSLGPLIQGRVPVSLVKYGSMPCLYFDCRYREKVSVHLRYSSTGTLCKISLKRSY